MLTLTFVRHGQTDYNADGRVQGRGIDSDLNALGRWQAERLAARFHAVPLDAVYTSSMRRTHQTAAPVLESRADLWTEPLADLDEMDWGVYEGKAASSSLKEQYQQYVERWTAGEFTHPVDGGESPQDVETRALRAIRHIRTRHEGGHVLVVTHGRLLRVLLASILPDFSLHRMQELTHENTAVSIVELTPEGPRARLLNDTSHLDAARAA